MEVTDSIRSSFRYVPTIWYNFMSRYLSKSFYTTLLKILDYRMNINNKASREVHFLSIFHANWVLLLRMAVKCTNILSQKRHEYCK